jgi:RNA polymerase sigma-70 factor (ECF subfamily)
VAAPLLSAVADIIDEGGFAAVVAAAGRGEHSGLTDLFRVYQPMLLRYLRARDPVLADDLASEVWVAVARRLGGFVGDERGFRSWLFTIARCRLIEHRRKLARRRTDPVSHDRLDRLERPPAQSGGDDPAVLLVERMTAQAALDAVVADLTSDQAEAVLLRVIAGFDVGETARIMRRSPGSVRVLCHRALRQLAMSLTQEVGAE